MFKNLKFDLPAGLVVFLVALPLCLGVAVASGAPPISGIISGIIGGIVVGLLSESNVSVSGPAAGLTAIVFSSIDALGSFDVFLAAVMISGLFQLVLGLTKSGFIADYIPSNVIKGLLAAIGIILILKQIPHAFGIDSDAEGEFSFFQTDGENTFSELLKLFDYMELGAIIIAAISFLILTQWKRTPFAKYNFLPASLVVVIMGVLINIFFKAVFPDLALMPSHLVDIPDIHSANDLITFPSFSKLASPKLWTVAFTIAAVASLETLLNLEAVEKIDPHKRVASPNRELIAQGVGNMVSGMVGGLPVTSVIVRSSVNIQSGGRSKMSTVLHGLFLLVSVVFLTSTLREIPLSALAAILIFIGYKLANVTLFKDMYSKGLNQFVPFVVTVVAIVFTDLLLGIIIGLAVSIFYILKSNYKNPFSKEVQKLHTGETIRLELSNQVSFLNKASIKNTLWNVEPNSKVIIDARNSDYIDNDVLEIISDFSDLVSHERNIQTNVLGLKENYQLEDHIDFLHVYDSDTLSKMSPYEILDILKKGNDRFQSGVQEEKYFHHQIEALSKNENPLAIIISCIDARISPDIIFDVSLGDLISIRVSGNVISDEVLGSLEHAISRVGIKLIVILGHQGCDSVKTAISGEEDGNFSSISSKIKRAVNGIDAENLTPDVLDIACKSNVNLSIEDIKNGSSIISQNVQDGDIAIVPAFYEMNSGKVDFNL